MERYGEFELNTKDTGEFGPKTGDKLWSTVRNYALRGPTVAVDVLDVQFSYIPGRNYLVAGH